VIYKTMVYQCFFWICFSEQLLKKHINFYQDEFEEGYSHYEKILEVIEDSKEFFITGKISFSKIVIQIINRNYVFC